MKFTISISTQNQIDEREIQKAFKTLSSVLECEVSLAMPNEACGVLVRHGTWQYVPLENVALKPEREFAFDTNELVQTLLEYNGLPKALYHSHPVGPSALSGPDIRLMQKIGLDMVLVNLRDQELSWHRLNQQGRSERVWLMKLEAGS